MRSLFVFFYKKIFCTFRDFLFPCRCVLCDKILQFSHGLCLGCAPKIIFIHKDYCKRCGNLLKDKNYFCSFCFKNILLYNMARSVFVYNAEGSLLIKKYKFHDKILYTDLYAQWLVEFGSDLLFGADYIVPVPLHKSRIIQRKYNQAAMLSNSVSCITGIPVLLNSLKRIRNTKPQYCLSSSRERALNVKNAFCCSDGSLANLVVILIDDLLTTGSTVNECAKAILKNGAKEVRVLTLARVIDGDFVK